MPMVHCVKCGKLVSTRAESCCRCGEPLADGETLERYYRKRAARRKLGTMIAASVLLMIVLIIVLKTLI